MSLKTSLISSWELNEASSNALDSHGSNTLTPTGGAIGAAAGPNGVGGSRDFESGDTEWFAIADNASVSTGDIDFTIEAWVNIESLTGADQDIVSKYETSGNQREYRLFYNTASARFSFAMSATGTSQSGAILANGTPSTGTWYQLIAWHDATNNEMGIAVNAEASPATSAYSSGVFDSTASFQLGARGTTSPSAYFDGLMAKVRLWKRILTSQERTDLYNSGDGLAYTAFETATGITVSFDTISTKVNFPTVVTIGKANTSVDTLSAKINLPTITTIGKANTSLNALSVKINLNDLISIGKANVAINANSCLLNLNNFIANGSSNYQSVVASVKINQNDLVSTGGSGYDYQPLSARLNLNNIDTIGEANLQLQPISVLLNLANYTISGDSFVQLAPANQYINLENFIFDGGQNVSLNTASILVNLNNFLTSGYARTYLDALSVKLLLNSVINSVNNRVDLSPSLMKIILGSQTVDTGSITLTPIIVKLLFNAITIIAEEQRKFMSYLIEIDQDTLDMAEIGFTEMLEMLGKNCLLFYPSKWTQCINCIWDNIGQKSSNRYRSGGPAPFQIGNCPMCSGVGKLQNEEHATIKMTIDWRPKNFDIFGPNIRLPSGGIVTRGYITDLPKVEKCDKMMIVNPGMQSYGHYSFKLAGEVVEPFQIIQNKFFAALWQRVG
jgi:hypothetical protein